MAPRKLYVGRIPSYNTVRFQQEHETVVAPQGDQPVLSPSLTMNTSILSDPRTAPENNDMLN